MHESARRIGDQNVLRKVDVLMDWSLVLPLLKTVQTDQVWVLRVILGPEGYDQIILVKCLLIGQWHGVSDSKLEETLRVRFDALLLAGLDLHCTVRDETAHFRSRNARVRAGA